MKWLNDQVLDSSGHNVKSRNLTFVKKLKMCAIVKRCQQIADTPSDTYENIKLHSKINQLSKYSFSACASNSKTAHTRSQTGKDENDSGKLTGHL
jgi:hypothetical protein